MKHLFTNLKRFDVPRTRGGVNDLAPPSDWAATILGAVSESLRRYRPHEFTFFLPESHVLPAIAAAGDNVNIGCQSVSSTDTAPGGNFGAMTAERSANSMAACGVTSVLVGHSEERAALVDLLARFHGTSTSRSEYARFADQEMNLRARAAQQAGLQVVLCIGESSDQREEWADVVAAQLDQGLSGLDDTRLALAYEPIWAIGPGKTPPTPTEISEVARFVKAQAPGIPLVYGGGLKVENAAMLAAVPDIDGGLIALTRFSGDIGFNPNEYLDIVNTYLTTAGA
ncbi:MAG: triose-phosphate isomerase family protein [Propioniciclava sp.]